MSEFIVTGPDGKRYRVRGDSAEGAARAVASLVGGGSARIADGVRARSEAQGGQVGAERRAAEADQIAMDQMTLSGVPVPLRAVTSFTQGIPLVGEWTDELTGVIGGPEAAQAQRDTQGAMERLYPKTALGLQVAGGIASTAPLLALGGGSRAADFVARGGSRVSQGVRAAGVGAGVGGVEGVAAGSGRADEAGEGGRLRGAAIGAGVGAGLGAALGVFAPMLGEGVANLVRRAKKLDVSTIAAEFGVSPAAARSVKEALVNDDLGAAVSRLGQLGDDAMLADAGPATQALLDAASKTGGRALAVTREAVEGRSQALGARLPQRLDSILGRAGGVRAAARDIAQRTAPARQAAYQRAYSAPINYADDAGRSIESVLSRVPPNTLSRAISEANEAMTEAGTRNMQIMARIADDGSVTFQQMPNVQQLDEIKKALDSIGREAVDQFGRPTAQGARAQRLARDLRNALGDAVPAYRSALKIGGDKIKEDQALDVGRKLLWKNTTVEDVRDLVSDGMSVEARDAVRRGLRETIEGTMSNVRRTITDPNTDAREAMQLVKEVSSRANKEKLRLVLGEGRANALLDELDKMATALTLRGAVARNSDTAIRQAVQGQVRDEATPGLLTRTLGNMGNPLEAAREVTQTVAGIDPRSMSAAEQQIFAEIADALTRIQGSQAQRALAAAQRALQGQPIKDAEAQLIGRVVAGSAAVGGYRAGTQALAPQ